MPSDASRKPSGHSRRPLRLRTVFAIASLLLLIFPAALVGFLCIHKNTLLREAENTLIAQANIIAATYKHQLLRALPEAESYGVQMQSQPALPTPHLRLWQSRVLGELPLPQATATAADPYASVAGNNLDAILRDIRHSTTTKIILMDYQGIITAPRIYAGEALNTPREIQLALHGHYAAALRRSPAAQNPSPSPLPVIWPGKAEDTHIHTALPITDNGRIWGVVYLIHPAPSLFEALVAQRNIWLPATGILVLLVLAVALFLHRMVNRPMRQLSNKLRSVAKGDTAAITPLAQPRTQEMAVLSKHFSRIASMLHSRTEYIRHFASHMSHELKAPLCNIQDATGALIDGGDAMSAEERRRYFNDIMQDSERLKRLTSRLLEMARADSTVPDGNESCYIMPILKRLAEQYSDRSFTISFGEEGHYDARISADSFESIISHLLENAKQHKAQNLCIDFQLDEQELRIRLANDGEPISEDCREKIFTPFFSTVREQGKTGLGLSIVRSLLEAHGGRIENEPAVAGSAFIITLPIIP